MRIFKRAAGAALLACTALATATAIATATPSSTTTVLTGSIDRTYSLGQCGPGHACWSCKQAVDLDVVRIDVDTSAVSKDALGIDAGCTGRIGLIDIRTKSADGIKGAPGAHDLVIGGGTVSSTARYATAHQDCAHWMGGLRIAVVGVVFRCTTANNAQWFLSINKQSANPSPPTDVVCSGCEFHPGLTSYHSVTVGPSLRSGAVNSLVCPGTSHGLQWKVLSTAVSVVDVNNTKPWPSSPRCP